MAYSKAGSFKGAKGDAGVAGADGQRGSIITSGTGAPTPTGNERPGDTYIDTATGDFYIFS